MSKSLLLALFLAFIGLSHALTSADIDQIIQETIAELVDDSDMAVTCRVTAASGLNFRTSPSTSGKIIKALASGTTGTKISDASNGWVQMNFGGQTGYVSGQYLSCSGSPGTGGGGSSGGKTGKTGTQGCDSRKNKYVESLQEVLGHEGSCQNSASDSGNKMNGKVGYTCAGIIPSVGYNARNTHFSYAVSACGNKAEMFVKCAWDLNRSKFLDGASAVYRQNYFNVCDHLAQPAFFVCSDISVNSGPGKAKEFMRELGACGADVKAYATALNQKHREFYKIIGAPGKTNNKFLQGWLNRAAARDRFIQKC